MKVLITYDVKKTTDTIHSELKNRLMLYYGYSNKIQSDTGVVYDLPNTTLIKSNVSTNEASNNFLQACKEVGAIWERYIAVDYNSATFNNQ